MKTHWIHCDCVDHNKLWKILWETGIPDHLTYLLRSLYAGQEATVRTRHGTMYCFKTGKRVHQACILSPCLFNFYAEYTMRNIGLYDSQAWNQDCQEKYQQFQICRRDCSNGRSWRGTKEPLHESDRGKWKSWFETQHSKNQDHGIQPHHVMANRRGRNGSSDIFYFLSLQNHCRWWLQLKN